MPLQSAYPTLTTLDNTTFVTGFYTDALGKLQSVKVPASYVYGDKWTYGTGTPTVVGVGAGDMYLDTLTGNVWQWNGTAWTGPIATLISGIYDIPIQVLGVPLTSEVIYLFAAPRHFTLPQNLTNSQGIAQQAATGTATFVINKNGSQVGSFAFAAGATVATFTLAAATAFLPGDILTVVAPATQDATLANIAITLAATRP